MAVAYARGAPSAIAQWNGGAWSVQPLTLVRPDPAGIPLLDALSCSSPVACTAVGFSAGDLGPTALRWDGSAWAVEPVPAPTGSTGAELNGVDCPAADRCVAVGSYDAATPDRAVPFAEQWNGASWRVEQVVEPSGGRSGSELDDVSCVAPTSCMAVGSAGDVPFAASLVGPSWMPAGPMGAGDGTGVFDAVSCLAPARCIAVGHGDHGLLAATRASRPPAPISGGLAELWDGRSWRSLLRGGVAGGHAMVGISCPTASVCAAVGSAGGAEWWSSGRWERQLLAIPEAAQKRSMRVLGISCVSAARCEAVGSFRPLGHGGAAGTVALAEGWDGRTWRVQSVGS